MNLGLKIVLGAFLLAGVYTTAQRAILAYRWGANRSGHEAVAASIILTGLLVLVVIA